MEHDDREYAYMLNEELKDVEPDAGLHGRVRDGIARNVVRLHRRNTALGSVAIAVVLTMAQHGDAVFGRNGTLPQLIAAMAAERQAEKMSRTLGSAPVQQTGTALQTSVVAVQAVNDSALSETDGILALVVSERASKPVEDVLTMRTDGMGWGLIMTQLDVSGRDVGEAMSQAETTALASLRADVIAVQDVLGEAEQDQERQQQQDQERQQQQDQERQQQQDQERQQQQDQERQQQQDQERQQQQDQERQQQQDQERQQQQDQERQQQQDQERQQQQDQERQQQQDQERQQQQDQERQQQQDQERQQQQTDLSVTMWQGTIASILPDGQFIKLTETNLPFVFRISMTCVLHGTKDEAIEFVSLVVGQKVTITGKVLADGSVEVMKLVLMTETSTTPQPENPGQGNGKH